MTSLLHINDNQLRLQLADDRLVMSQGYAWLKDESVVFDIDPKQASAIQQYRLNPQQINNRYWQQCDQSNLSANSVGMRHAADLIWQHLGQLQAQHQLHELVLVIPSHYQESQLQLLLGVAQACELSILSLVNKAVVELSNHDLANGDYKHVDVQLHQTVCSNVSIADGRVTLTDVAMLPNVGIHLMQEALLHGLQSKFIQDDRFDPLHDAATEQQLFDQLPSIAMGLNASGSANIGVEHQSRLHSISVEKTIWSELLMPFENSIRDSLGDAKKALIDLNGAFGSVGLSGLDEPRFTMVQTSRLDDCQRFLNGNKEGGEVVYQTQLGLVQKLSPARPPENEVASKRQFDEQKVQLTTIENSASHIVLAGKAVAIENAFIEHTANGLTLDKKALGNVRELVQSKKLFIINDDQRNDLRANDRLGSHLADGILTVVQEL